MLQTTRFAFFGSPRFAEIVLDKLIDGGFTPEVLICNPDRPVGRKQVITPPPVKQLIANRKAQIEIFQPERLNDVSCELRATSYDFFVVAAYAKIISREILNIPRLGTIGVHPSLLPKYRGASPIQTAILEGEKETGVTLYLMDEKLDHGPILAQKLAIIGQNEDYLGLERRLAALAGELLAEILPRFLRSEISPKAQDEAEATLTKKFTTQDAFVDYNDLLDAEAGDLEKALKINRMARAFIEEPGAWMIEDGKRVKILESEVLGVNLKLKKIQIEGGKPKFVDGRK